MSLILDSIKASIDFEYECMQFMLQLLQQEESALIEDHFDLIEELTALKNNIVAQLQSSAEKRFELFEQIQDGTQSFTEWLNEENHQELYNSWTKLMKVTSQAKEINSTNGLILNQLAVRNQRFLSFLKGENDASLYGPDGLNMTNSLGSIIKG